MRVGGEQPSLAAFLPQEDERPIVYVDSREASTRPGKRIIEKLNELGSDVRIKALDYGDYLIGENVAVERKAIPDFATTLTKRFLFDQILEMKKAYPESLLLLEGYMGVLRKFSRISPESLNGALFALAKSGIPIIPTIDYKDTALFLFIAAKQLQKEEKAPVIRRGAKGKSLRDQQLYAVAGLPHLGPILAERLLKHFKTVKRIFAASEEELAEVKGVGKQIARGIVTVIDTSFESEEAQRT